MAKPLRLLIVDHQVGPRECLCELVRALGFHTVGVGSPDLALEELERGGFDVLVTGEDLDDLVTGTLLIEEGRRRGLLRDVRCVLLAAHPVAGLPPETSLVMMPQQAERLEQLLRRFEAERRPQALATVDPIRLVLYLRSSTPSSQRALDVVEEALTHFPPGSVALDVRDLSRDPEAPVEHDVVLTPALVREGGGSSEWLMGELDSAAPVVTLLEQAGLTPREPARVARPRSNRPA